MGVRAAEAVFQEATYLAVDASTNSTTVYTGPCVYYGAVITTALSAQALPIKDGSNTIDSFAASAAVGTSHFLAAGIRCDTSLVVDPDDAATGNLTVFYRPLASFTP